MPAMFVTVLCGGESTERDVSLASGYAIGRAIAERGNEVRVIDPAAESPFLTPRVTSPELVPAYAVPEVPPDMSRQASWRRQLFSALTGGPVLEELRRSDLVFVALHGGWGEDGHVQALLDMAGLRYTGAGAAVCAAAWHKDFALGVLHSAGVPVAERVRHVAGRSELPVDAKRLLDDGPVVVKPAAGGSSVSISLVSSAAELLAAAASASGELLIEPYLPGREFTVGVLGDEVLPVIEIELSGPLFDYRAKYQPGAAREICPADIPVALESLLRDLALRAHQALGFGPRTYSRVDFRLDAAGTPRCMELNALPGMTPGSLLPLAARTVGCSYAELVSRIIALAV
jgi:D-alanine-D-alanine ligase